MTLSTHQIVKHSLLTVLSCIFLASTQTSFANDLGNPSKEALTSTKEMLRDPKKRQEVIGKDEKAKEAHRNAESLGGSPENTEKIYQLAADVMEEITKQANGDPQKMMELLQKAQTNPKEFANSLSDQNKKKLRETAAQIEASKQGAPAQR